MNLMAIKKLNLDKKKKNLRGERKEEQMLRKSPCHMLQAQRDYFCAHTYERTDRPRGQFFHTEWLK